MGRLFEVTEWTRFPLQTPSDCFAFSSAWLSLDVRWEITIFLLLVFLHSVCLDCLTGQINRSNGWNNQEGNVLFQQALCQTAERKGKKQFPPCVYMPTHESHLAALNCRKTIRAKHNNICMHDFCNMFSVSSFLPTEQVLAILKCQVHFMNFTLCLIITITMLSKILGAFNAVFSYTGISLRSLVKKVGIIYHHLAYSMHEPPLLMSVYACLSVQYVNPSVE